MNKQRRVQESKLTWSPSALRNVERRLCGGRDASLQSLRACQGGLCSTPRPFLCASYFNTKCVSVTHGRLGFLPPSEGVTWDGGGGGGGGYHPARGTFCLKFVPHVLGPASVCSTWSLSWAGPSAWARPGAPRRSHCSRLLVPCRPAG